MSDPKTQQEPTMEEILASIRRIIADDQVGGGPAAAPEATASPIAAPVPAAAPISAAKPAAAPKALEPLPPPSEPPPAPEPSPPPVVADAREQADFDDSVLELTDIVEEGSPPPPPMSERPKPRLVETPPPEPALVAATPSNLDLSTLISDAPAAAAASSFKGFATHVQQARGVVLGTSARTLEELIKDLLRPMLKEWLDRNLPPLVQRLVERELQKLAGHADEKKQ